MKQDKNERLTCIYQKMYPIMYRTAYRLTGSAEKAEELVHDAFSLALSRQDTLISHPNPEGWLMKTLKNVVRNTKRQRAKLNMLAVISLNSEESELLATYDEIDIDVLYGDEAKREDFQIFKMVAVEGRSMRETADEFGISIEACKKRVQRIKKRLQKKLSKE